MKSILIVLFVMVGYNSLSQCTGVPLGGAKQRYYTSCYDTVKTKSVLNIVEADSGTFNRIVVTSLTDGLVKSVSDVLTPAVAGTDYLDPAELDSATALKDAMFTLVIGNSIAAQSQWKSAVGGYWSTSSDVHYANALAGSPMIFKRVTASTRMDGYCVYGYSGQVLSTILGDLQAQVFTPLQTANITPRCVWGHSLIENDIATSVSVADMQAGITRFIRDIKARFPGVIIILSTPRPSFSYNTPTLVSNYQTMVSYIQALDNGKDIFVCTLNAYEDPGTSLPLAGYTDATVHPNAKGALLLARTEAATFQRIGKIWKQPYFAISSNMPLSGTAAASGTNVSGNVPTSTTITGSANGTFIGTAEQPGFTEEIQLPVDTTVGAFLDLSSTNFGSVSVTTNNGFQYSAFITIEIVSGAHNINNIDFRARAADGSGNPFIQYMTAQTGDATPDWQNGDILTLVMPPQVAVTAPITGINNYILCKANLIQDGAGFKFRIINQGVGIVQEFVNPKFITNTATLNFDLTSVNSQDLTITVTGATDGDAVSVGVPNASATANVVYTWWTSATNTVTVRASRIDVASGADPASGTFRASVIKY